MRYAARLICCLLFISGSLLLVRVGWASRNYLGNEELFDAQLIHSTDFSEASKLIAALNTSRPTEDDTSQPSACLQQRVPRIIHQTFKTTDVPQPWLHAQEMCRTLHQNNWKYMFWTDADAERFIGKHYPWFLSIYLGYPYNIQRVDAVRYFILFHFGGIYIDLDIGCNKDLTPFLNYDALFPKTHPWGVSNDFMTSRARHPFFEQLIHNLASNSRFWATKYPSVIFSTGPMFLTSQLGQYLRRGTKNNETNNYNKYTLSQTADEKSSNASGCDSDGIFILPDELYANAEGSFFIHYDGSSWHGTDVRVVEYVVERKLVFSMLILFSVALGVSICVSWHRIRALWRKEAVVYHNLATDSSPIDEGWDPEQ